MLTEQEILDLPNINQMINGAILRNKIVSKVGQNSGAVFVPKFLIGQKVKVIIFPENTEVCGLRQTVEKKNRKISKLNLEIKGLKSGNLEKSETPQEIPKTKPENLEEEDAF